MSTELTQISMQEYAKSINAINGRIINGPNKDFIKFQIADGTSSTIACGPNSQGMERPSELSVLSIPPNEKYPNGGYVATVNKYVELEVETF